MLFEARRDLTHQFGLRSQIRSLLRVSSTASQTFGWLPGLLIRTGPHRAPLSFAVPEPVYEIQMSVSAPFVKHAQKVVDRLFFRTEVAQQFDRVRAKLRALFRDEFLNRRVPGARVLVS